jgi:DNA ligase-1
MSALARAIVYTPPNKPDVINSRKKVGDNKFLLLCEQMEASIKQAFCEFPHYGEVVKRLLECGDEHQKLAQSCHIRVGIPVKPMLAKPTKGV